MITKKQPKSKATTKTGYDLNNIKTKKTSQPKKKSGALHGFFSIIGFIGVVGGLASILVPLAVHADTITHNGNETIIQEDFSCKVALADLAELQRVLEITPRTDFKYKIFLDEYEAVVKDLAKHSECKGGK